MQTHAGQMHDGEQPTLPALSDFNCDTIHLTSHLKSAFIP